MRISRDTDYRQRLLDSQRRRMGVGVRRSGVHVSDLIMCIRKSWAEKQANYAQEVDDQTILTWLRGLSHEALLTDGIEQVRAGYCFQCQKNYAMTPALMLDNLCPQCNDTLMVGTIDWVTFEDTDGVQFTDFLPVEMKSTLKSSNKTLEQGDMLWFTDQLKSYMFMHNRDAGRIAILHVMGDYARSDPNFKSGGPKAELRVYKIEWENDAEKVAWGEELKASKAIIEGDSKPPLDARSPRHEFICDYCWYTDCERYPFTEEGVRKGSVLASKFTLEQMELELERLKGECS